MRNSLFAILVCSLAGTRAFGQELSCNDPSIAGAFNLAVKTVDINTRRGILAAGADYGSEWTRDISINSWNGASLLRPAVAQKSLWSVTVDRDTVGHQYWDKIIWVVAAWHHYLVNGDDKAAGKGGAGGDPAFLRQAYTCSAATMKSLEQQTFDKADGLFMGPSVFNDGIAAYPEPVYEPANYSSFVLDHAGARRIKCLSTNCIYYGAYQALSKMATMLHEDAATIQAYDKKAAALKDHILQHFYDRPSNRFAYLIDQYGHVYPAQEALGLSFAVIFGIVDHDQARALTENAVASPFGITSIYPSFPRNTPDKPGRHNDMIWPMVNGFFAQAAIDAGDERSFTRELFDLTHLALDVDKGDYDFREIYNAKTGKPDGGWQANGPANPQYHWESCKLQTWSATAYISMILHGVFGLRFSEHGLAFEPFLPESTAAVAARADDIDYIEIKALPYRESILDISIQGHGHTIKKFLLDGKEQADHAIDASIKGKHQVFIVLEGPIPDALIQMK